MVIPSMSDENRDQPANNVVDFAARRKQAKAPESGREVSIVADATGLLEAFGAYIERGMVMVTLDATLVGVSIPNALRGNPQLTLNFSHRFFIDDFVYDERGVRASLSFSGQPFICDLPWSAIWMLRCHADDQITLAPTHVPEALRSTLLVQDSADGAEPQLAESIPLATAPKPLDLTAAETPDALTEVDAAPQSDSDDDPPPAGPPVLKLIKG